MSAGDALFDFMLGLGDDRLVLGHRLSQWCGFAPILEEELALANIALDLIGQAEIVLGFAASHEGRGRSADDLAYLRDSRAFRNALLVEQPNGDFAATIARQFLFDAWDVPQLEALTASTNAELAGFAGKAVKEAAYHLRHSREWVIRLGDGTDESHARMQRAIDPLWDLTPELFRARASEQGLVADGIIPASDVAFEAWEAMVVAALSEAGLERPDARVLSAQRGRDGLHSEHLGHLLAEMQVLQRSHPGASW